MADKIYGKLEEVVEVHYNGSYIVLRVEEDGNGNEAEILLYKSSALELIERLKSCVEQMK